MNENNGYIKVRVFIASMTVAFALIGVVYNKADKLDIELETYKDKHFDIVSEIDKKVVEIGTNVDNIKDDIGEIKNKLNSYDIVE